MKRISMLFLNVFLLLFSLAHSNSNNLFSQEDEETRNTVVIIQNTVGGPQTENVLHDINVKFVSSIIEFMKHFPNTSDIKRIIVHNPFFNREIITKFPKEKLVGFLWEPYILPTEIYDNYSRVYTWDDSLVDNIKIFRFNYPYLMPFRDSALCFEDKKFCTMIVRNWTKKRSEMVRFFESKQINGFEIYGANPNILENTSIYKGFIPGSHSGEEKISVLQNYRFCICFENTIEFQGYISEKIFSCFAAGCIPIYLGATNIEQYIPKTCFIDYRDFNDNEELYQYITNMSQEEHQQYIEEIKNYLQSEQAQLFSTQFYDKILHETVAYD